MKVLVINQHIDNYGDEAAGMAVAQQVRELFPDADLGITYNHSGNTEGIPFNDERTRHYGDFSLRKRDVPAAVRYLLSKVLPFLNTEPSSIESFAELVRAADVVIVSPCGANIGIYQDWRFLFRVLVAVLEGRRPIFHLNTIGKSGSVIFDAIARYVLRRSVVFVRESKSEQQLEDWGIATCRGVDSVFSLQSPPDEGVASTRQYVAFIPTRLQNWHVSYRTSDVDARVRDTVVPELVEFCQKHSLELRLIPHLKGHLAEYDLLEEYRSAFEAHGMSPDSVVIESGIGDVFAYEKAIRSAECVVSMRYHGVVFAVKNCVPFVSLGYESKMGEVSVYSGMERFNRFVHELGREELRVMLASIMENREAIVGELARRQPLLDRLARLPMQKVYLDRCSGRKR